MFLGSWVFILFQEWGATHGGQGVVPGSPPGNGFSRGGLSLGWEQPAAIFVPDSHRYFTDTSLGLSILWVE